MSERQDLIRQIGELDAQFEELETQGNDLVIQAIALDDRFTVLEAQGRALTQQIGDLSDRLRLIQSGRAELLAHIAARPRPGASHAPQTAEERVAANWAVVNGKREWVGGA